MIIDRILLLLGLDATDESIVTLIQEIVKLVAMPVVLRLGTEDVPAELEYIVIELAIARYNRIGAEGYADERSDNVQNSFIENLFEQYIPALDAWKEANSAEEKPRAVKFF